MKQHKLIFIEGLPGSGKTTFAKRLHQFLTNHGQKAHHYIEGGHNPLSLAWQSLCSDKEYLQLLQKYPKLSTSVKYNTIKRIGKNVVTYTKVDVPEEEKDFYDYVSEYEIYKADKEDFVRTYQKLYQEFSQTHQTLTESNIFECALLQNHVNQMLAVYDADDEEILEHIRTLTDFLLSSNVVIIYVKQKHIKKTLEKISNERRSPNKNMFPDWIDKAIQYIENTSYGKANNLKGKEGLTEYFLKRQEIEEMILKKLNISYKIIVLDDDYEQVFEEIKKAIINS